ncbi:MAG: tRNA (adenosine(37)-N6)-threonylcarbamoyltransferase complex dimerization subunit type 1 TsaB [Gammaproteobacteria bacterium]|jgi:tRNA threonylcarbamoyladenosine biosynthesis protein TsaB
MSEKLLALETSTMACSAALYADGRVEERYALAPRQHASLILPMLESLLVEADLAVGQLDAVAFGCGPGSFTGVRIAASVAQGVSFGAGLPVLPVSSLAALALGAIRESGEPAVMAAQDARKAEVYWGCYRRADKKGVALHGEECVCAPGAVPVPLDGNWVGAGSGWQVHADILLRRPGGSVVRLLPDLEPHAGDVARLALHALRAGMAVAPEAALPVYLRNNVADEGAVGK